MRFPAFALNRRHCSRPKISHSSPSAASQAQNSPSAIWRLSIKQILSVNSILLASPLLRSCVCGGGAAPAVREEQAAIRYYVSGIVQGVGYRYFARGAARKLGLAGYVRNLNDGRVEVYAIGLPAALNALRDELHRGPHSAKVSGVIEESASLDSRFTDQFSIEFDA